MNKNYVNGRNKEYRLIKKYKSLGYTCIRSAGSHSPIDIVAIHPISHKILLVQSKPKSMSKKAKEKLEKEIIRKYAGHYLVLSFVE